MVDKTKGLDAILVQRGDLNASLRDLLNQLVDKHIERNGQSIQHSLASLSSVSHVRQLLLDIGDTDLKQSLSNLRESEDPFKTYTTGQMSDSGGARFQIRRPLGRGGLGVVSVAHDRELNREVALKEIREDQSQNETMRRKFLVEAEITGNLEHPGIVPVYGLGIQVNGRPYYAMRFVKGDNLGVHIKRFHSRVGEGLEPYNGSELRGLLRRFLDICDAIGYAHSRGVLHRDLKPGNIMLGKYGETLVVDWGLAKPKGASDQITSGSADSIIDPKLSDFDATKLGAALGTPAYAPPEQMGGKLSEVNERSDVYGLGAILYELLCDSPPVNGSNIEEIISKILRGDFPPPKKKLAIVPAPLSAICMKALALSPKDRYETTNLLMKDVESWLDDLPVSAHQDGAVSKAGRLLRRNKGAAIAAIVGILALAFVSGIYAWVANGLRRSAEIEKGIAIEERKAAVNERNEAKTQRERADRHFQQARESVDRFLTSVSEDPQLALAGFQSLRKRLLSDALKYYEKFRSENEKDDSLWRETAEANLRVAMICESLGDYSVGLMANEQASLLIGKRLQTDKSSDLKLEWARSELLRTSLLSKLGRTADARSAAQALNEVIRLQSAEDSQPNDYRRILAASYDSLAGLANSRTDRKEAEKAISESLRLREEDATNSPSAGTLLALANTRLLSVVSSAEQRNFREAISTYVQVLASLENLTLQDSDTVLLAKRAEVSHLLATSYAGQGETKLAGEYYQKAVDFREELVVRNSILNYQVDLAKSLADLSVTLKIQGQTQESESASARSFQLSETIARYHPKSPEAQIQFAEGLLRRIGVGKTDDDLALVQRIESILLPIIENKSARTGARLLLARAYDAGSTIFSKEKNYREAINWHGQAMSIRESLVKDFPDEVQHRRALANSVAAEGALREKTLEFDQAIVSYEKAIESYRELLSTREDDDDTRIQLAATLYNAGNANSKTRAIDRASHWLTQATQELSRLRPTTSPVVVIKVRDSILKLQQAISLEQGDFRGASTLASQRASLRPSDASASLGAAKSIAGIVEKIPIDEASQAVDRDFCIGLCLDELSRLQKLGFTDASAIKGCKEFHFLSANSRFSQILDAMEKR